MGSKLHLSLPNIPQLARGAVINRPTMAIVGEAGTEAVVPTNDIARARQLLAQAGILDKLAPSGSGTQQTNYITVNAPTSDPEVVAMQVANRLAAAVA